jgi:hypothetical protein
MTACRIFIRLLKRIFTVMKYDFPIRSSDFGELASHPELAQESATVIPGTGTAVLPITLLTEIASAPDARERLADIADALIEEEYAFAMTVLNEEDTGIFNTLWFQRAPGIRDGPRIKVMIDPAKAVSPGRKQPSIPFDPGKPAQGDISPALERQVRDFIELNREALLREWTRGFGSTRQFLAALRPLPKT